MKKYYSIYFLLSLFVITLGFTSCDDDDDDEDMYEKLNTTVYTLDASCTWNMETLPLDGVILIQNKEDMDEYLSEEGDKSALSYPDFTKHTLMLVTGATNSGIAEIKHKLYQKNGANFKVVLDISIDGTSVAPRYSLAILAPRVKGKVEKTVNIKTD